jgi:hypothetical protein
MHNNSTRKEGKYIPTAKQKRDNDIDYDTKGICTLAGQREEEQIRGTHTNQQAN